LIGLIGLASTPLLAGCAHRRSEEALERARVATQGLLRDALFARPSQMPDPEAVMRPSAEMREYAERSLRRHREPRAALIDALFHSSGLKLYYDAERTRDAANTFAERAGNCMSLVLMTASFARMLELPVTFQTVVVDEAATRSGDYVFLSGHVNIVLGQKMVHRGVDYAANLVVDFLPTELVAGYRTQTLTEAQLLSMYMNNRAAEALAQAKVPDAYWWAREAVQLDPAASGAANTLGVVYSRSGHADLAEAAWRHALDLAPDSTSVLANLVQQLQRLGREREAAPLAGRLAHLQPVPPLHWLRLGREAYERGDYAQARVFFLRELRRQPQQAEVHFWLGLTHAKLGQAERAASDLAQAVTHSTTSSQQQIYAGKLARLREALPALR
jgi:Tfp pilus assembly protein PilF